MPSCRGNTCFISTTKLYGERIDLLFFIFHTQFIYLTDNYTCHFKLNFRPVTEADKKPPIHFKKHNPSPEWEQKRLHLNLVNIKNVDSLLLPKVDFKFQWSYSFFNSEPKKILYLIIHKNKTLTYSFKGLFVSFLTVIGMKQLGKVSSTG